MSAGKGLPQAPPPFGSSSPVSSAATATSSRVRGSKAASIAAPDVAVASGSASSSAVASELALLPEVEATGRPAGSKRPFQRRRRSRACDACRARKTKVNCIH
jgi:hypothetical protein